MLLKTFLLLAVLIYGNCNIYSSFWEPLFNPKILNYKVDINYDPDSGIKARGDYEKRYGYRGEKLIADLGNGVGPRSYNFEDNEKVTLYYTYPGADTGNAPL